ncbi:MAG TPA: alkaline phosphatase family protein [Marmoricola sp.]|nr:alkaline phosphatase family protein [Marmoricola sp.]
MAHLSHRSTFRLAVLAALASVTALFAIQLGSQSAGAATTAAAPPIGHVFVINLENKGYTETWGPTSAAPYLSQTLRAQGNLLTNYYGIGHVSLDNYIAQISGQGPNLQTNTDCQIYTDFIALPIALQSGQVWGTGCVYPKTVQTLPSQLDALGVTWKGYMDDMATPCLHPALNSQDQTQSAKVGAQYATRHDPFMYFHSIVDDQAYCNAHVVNYNNLATDLQQESTTPAFSYITPDLCNDGHDAPCVDGRPGGLASADAWLKQQIPMIMASPAYQDNGAIIITFDESDGPQSDSSACCGETGNLNSPLPGLTGNGGGRVGALVLSKYVTPGSTSATPYNHYSLLRSLEDIFGAKDHIGFAGAPGVTSFGSDVFNAG